MLYAQVPRFLYRLTVLFVAVWAIRSLVVMGTATMNEHYRTVLRTPPGVTQSVTGTSFDQSLFKIDRATPRTARVALIWVSPSPDYWAVFFWATYYLYPRQVAEASTISPDLINRSDALVFVRGPDDPPLTVDGFTLALRDVYPDVVVTTYLRNHG
jgi:hypothetical protein